VKRARRAFVEARRRFVEKAARAGRDAAGRSAGVQVDGAKLMPQM
jgi:hypothetical protein